MDIDYYGQLAAGFIGLCLVLLANALASGGRERAARAVLVIVFALILVLTVWSFREWINDYLLRHA